MLLVPIFASGCDGSLILTTELPTAPGEENELTPESLEESPSTEPDDEEERAPSEISEPGVPSPPPEPFTGETKKPVEDNPPAFNACAEDLASPGTLSPLAVQTGSVSLAPGANIRCVTQGDTYSDGHPCWQAPFTSVQAAVDASADGDEIWIAHANGIPYAANLTLKAGVALIGGFFGGESARQERDTSAHRAIIGTGDELIGLRAADRVRLDGLELRASPLARSMVVYAAGAAVQLRDVVIRGEDNSPKIGMAIFGERTAVTLEQCLIESIHADYGILIREGSLDVVNSVVRNVRTSRSALSIWESELNVSGSHFIGTTGGAIRSSFGEFAIANSVFFNNDASSGSALYSNRDQNSSVVNSTFFGNRSQLGIVESLHTNVEVINSVFGANESITGETVFVRSGSPVGIRNSALPGPGGFRDDGNNIWADIELVDPANGDFSLPQGSPAIDAGDASAAPEQDAQGLGRFDDPGTTDAALEEYVDLGAYEFSGLSVLRLLTPNGGQRFSPGRSQRITWYAYGIDALEIEYSDDGGKTWSMVGTRIGAGDGAATIDIPGRGSAHGRLRLSACGGGVTDPSDIDFTVVGNGDWYVNPKADVHDGTSFATGFATLHEALNVARYGEHIHVVQGTYGPNPDGGPFALLMKDGVDITGGYNAEGIYDPATHSTILRAEALTWREQSVVFGANAELRGFELTGGGDGIELLAGSVVVVGKHLTLRDSVVRNNREGVFVKGVNSRLTVIDSVIRDNRESTYFAPSGITVVNGGSLETYDTDVYNNTRNAVLASTGTYIALRGGYFRTTSGSSPAIQMGDGLIEDATLSSGSRGLWAFGEISVDRVLLDGCGYAGILAQNNAQVFVTNSTFAANRGNHASGVIVQNDATVEIMNATLHATEPEVPTFRALNNGSLRVANSIIAAPDDAPVADIVGDNASTVIEYSLTNLPFDGDGNIQADPEFFEAEVGDYSLAPTSPAIDAADPLRAPATDALGNERVDLGEIDNWYVDMGAFERQL